MPNQPNPQFFIYQTKDGETRLEVRLEDETVWLSQKLMAELFQKDVRTINEHIKNVFEEKELEAESTIRNFRIVQNEGNREVTRSVDFYNIDMIISVGYLVKSLTATRFRQWATPNYANTLLKASFWMMSAWKNRISRLMILINCYGAFGMAVEQGSWLCNLMSSEAKYYNEM